MPALSIPLPLPLSAPIVPAWVPSPDHLGIVVARYKESLDPWADVAANTYLYAKFETPQANDSVSHDSFKLYEQLPNLGREGRTYCHHIYEHYDELEPIIIFTQGDPFDHLAPETNTTQAMVEKALEPPEPKFDPVTIYNHSLIHDLAEWGKINWSDPSEDYWITPSQRKTLTYAPFDMAEFWGRLFEYEHPEAVRVSHGAVFAVRREAIWQHSRDLYERCLDLFTDDGQNTTNPEVGYFMERAWLALWSGRFWLSRVLPSEEL